MPRTTMTLTKWTISRSPEYYIITGVSNSGMKVDLVTALAPIDRGSHYIVQNVCRTLDIFLYKGEGECI